MLNTVFVMHLKVKLNTLHSTGENYSCNYVVKLYLLLSRFGCLLNQFSNISLSFLMGVLPFHGCGGQRTLFGCSVSPALTMASGD